MPLLLRPLKPTMSKLLERQTRHKLRPLNLRPTLAVSVLNYLRSGTNPLTARCTAGTVLPVVWSTRMARWRTLPTTLTLLTHRVVKCINHVSSHTPPVLFVFVLPELGNHVKESISTKQKRLSRIRPWGFLSNSSFILSHAFCLSKWDYQLIDVDGFQKTNQAATHNKCFLPFLLSSPCSLSRTAYF